MNLRILIGVRRLNICGIIMGQLFARAVMITFYIK